MDGSTIYAFGTGPAVSAVAVMRVSGSRSREVLEQLVGDIPASRRASLRRIFIPGSGEVLDQGLVFWFPGPNSFSGEDSFELHVHGSAAVRAALLKTLAGFYGCRPAEPGEFTRRAFINGKLDLDAVEALGDLLAAKTERQRQQALELSDGRVSGMARDWRSMILEPLSFVEAGIDFSDEYDASGDWLYPLESSLRQLEAKLVKVLKGEAASEIIRDGFRVALCGPPNSGKSSLINALSRRDVAIVSDVAGTTRDVLEVALDIEGLLVIVADAAGIRETEDPIEKLGVLRAKETALRSSLVLWLQEVCEEPHIEDWATGAGLDVVLIGTKSDLYPHHVLADGFRLAISSFDGSGVGALFEIIAERAKAAASVGEEGAVVRINQAEWLRRALAKTRELMTIMDSLEPEILAGQLRAIAFDLGRVSGDIGVEDVLGEIFSRFCIGK